MNRLLSILRIPFSPLWIKDTTGAVGLALVAWGLGWMYLPLAPLTIGGALVFCAIAGARRPGTEFRKDDQE